MLADRDQRDVDGRAAIERGGEVGLAEREVGVQLVHPDDLHDVVLAADAGEAVAAGRLAILEHAKRVAVVAGDHDAVAHRDLEIGSIVGAPVDDQRLGPLLILAALELAHGRVHARLVGLDEPAGCTSLAAEQCKQCGEQERSSKPSHAQLTTLADPITSHASNWSQNRETGHYARPG